MLSQLDANAYRAHCQTSDIILTLIQSACAHSSQGKFTYLLGKQQTTNQQSGNEIALWVKPCVILQDGGEAIVLINFLNLSLSPLPRKVILI